jgi:hypothetical protein
LDQAQSAIYVRAEFISEPLGREPLGVLPTGRGVDGPTIPLEHLDCIHQRAHALFLKEHSGWRYLAQPPDGLKCAALSIRDHRSAACLRFQWRDSEILLCSKDECPGSAQVIPKDLEWLLTQERDIPGSSRSYPPGLGPVSDHYQLALRHGGKRLYDQGMAANASTIKSIRLYGTMRDAVT